MYRPRAFRMQEYAELIAFMRAHSFATLVSTVDGAPYATHLPLLVEENETPDMDPLAAGEEQQTTDDTKQPDHTKQLVLSGHLAKANPQAQQLTQGESLAIFTGPHAYVSPSLYASPESVPTWNYIAVHAYGTPIIRALEDDPTYVRGMLERMMASLEPAYLEQWANLSTSYREGMLQGITAFEMVVTRLEGKAKLSQNRSAEDQANVAAALSASADPAAAAIGNTMQTRQNYPGSKHPNTQSD